jgi:hypothetical protein
MKKFVAYIFIVIAIAIGCSKEEDNNDTTKPDNQKQEESKEQEEQKQNGQTDPNQGADDNQTQDEQEQNDQTDPDQGTEDNQTQDDGQQKSAMEITVAGEHLKVELYDAFAQKETKHEGAVVEITGPNKVVYKATSDNNGVCRFTGLADGKYRANISKSGYYCPPISNGVVKLYRKAEGYISGLKFYQRPEGIAFRAKLNGITIPAGVKNITLRFFVAKTEDVSKTKYGFSGNTTGIATIIFDVPVSSIKDNEIDHRNSRFCGWRDALQGSKTYMVCYITSTYKTINDNFNEENPDNENTGLSAIKSASLYIN